MSKLLEYREKLNLTQEELSEKSGISIRTIQRIESGAKLKGYSLRALSDALEIKESELLDVPSEKLNFKLIKLINLSSLPFIIVPPFNIILPLILMYRKKEINSMTKQIVSVQILWTLLGGMIFLLSPFLNRLLSIDIPSTLIVLVIAIIINIYIIIQNTIAIDKHKNLRIQLNFSFL